MAKIKARGAVEIARGEREIPGPVGAYWARRKEVLVVRSDLKVLRKWITWLRRTSLAPELRVADEYTIAHQLADVADLRRFLAHLEASAFDITTPEEVFGGPMLAASVLADVERKAKARNRRAARKPGRSE